MEIEHYNNKMLAPEVAVQLLARNGINISADEAKKVLELLYFLVNLSIDQIVNT
ncbi:hypothetical protein [Mucilaginibacter pedocola]|uniref:hypothetical protein n=1 Tax=Mucilaginibacter pedocola TaxID=1792845 RepID=UPI0012DE9B35|nr:hypothetical protein [Mucilaginibacter pedocola]